MYFKKNGKKVFGVQLNAAEQKALEKEMNAQMAAYTRSKENDIDAMVLYALHTQFGFGAKRLRQFYDAFCSMYDELVEHYEMPEDFCWLCIEKLKDIGVDIVEWNRIKYHEDEEC